MSIRNVCLSTSAKQDSSCAHSSRSGHLIASHGFRASVRGANWAVTAEESSIPDAHQDDPTRTSEVICCGRKAEGTRGPFRAVVVARDSAARSASTSTHSSACNVIYHVRWFAIVGDVFAPSSLLSFDSSTRKGGLFGLLLRFARA